MNVENDILPLGFKIGISHLGVNLSIERGFSLLDSTLATILNLTVFLMGFDHLIHL